MKSMGETSMAQKHVHIVKRQASVPNIAVDIHVSHR